MRELQAHTEIDESESAHFTASAPLHNVQWKLEPSEAEDFALKATGDFKRQLITIDGKKNPLE